MKEIQMAIALLIGRDPKDREALGWFIDAWRQALLKKDPKLDIRIWPEVGDKKDIEALFLWSHPLGVTKQFPNAKLIYSLAAGVDHIFIDTDVNTNIPIVRVVDNYMANDIVQYVLAYALKHIKLLDHWATKQTQKQWFKQPPFNLSDKTIGIMGMGFLGKKAALMFQQLGLKTSGWSQSHKQVAGIKHYTGDCEFKTFIQQAELLICMLPLTEKTRGILNKNTFALMPKESYLINVGRGQHIIENDLLAALDSGQLVGATLDVFNQEPLPSDHPYWSHPKITVTPHIASVTNPETAVDQVYENYQRMQQGKLLENIVSAQKGY